MNNFKTEKKRVKIDLVVPNPWNPNVQSKEIFEKEKKSIKELGLLGSILVRERPAAEGSSIMVYEILDGEHRWKACKELGYTEITVENIGKISDSETKMLTVLLNNLRGKDDIFKRAKIFEALDSGQLELLPFSKQEIENEKELVKFDFSIYEKEEEFEERQEVNLITLKVTNKEKELWEKAVKVAKEKKGINEIKLFMEWVKYFLTLAVGADKDGDKYTF